MRFPFTKLAQRMATVKAAFVLSPWELAAETIAVKIRWFGIVFGYVVVNVDPNSVAHHTLLNAILALGVVYAGLDTAYSLRNQVFLGRWPLLISLMEALFIALLCFNHVGLESAFRYFYLLSLICCAIRYPTHVTYTTCALHCTSYSLLYLALPRAQQQSLPFLLTLVVFCWVAWASNAMAQLLKRVGEQLRQLNRTLQENQAHLEARIAERTRDLQAAQALVLHQEKMAAFGLLAAGIAHEVGNPLTSISAMVQMLQKRENDGYTQEKLSLVSGQLQRIQTTLRELVNFSRPASTERTRVQVKDILQEALNIAKYYRGTVGRKARLSTTTPPELGKGPWLEVRFADDLPCLWGVRDQLVQVFLNLILNAVDATAQGGRIAVSAEHQGDEIRVTVRDDGGGIAPEHQARLFQPYFTTKRHGTGLGLFVSHRLIAEHGGRIAFTSAHDQGTTFEVWLPAEEEPAARPAEPRKPEEVAPLS